MGNSLWHGLWLALTICPAIGCTVEDQLDREEAIPDNATRKSDLSGDWIFDQTAVGLSPQSSFSFEGESNWRIASKIRWEIQEDYLVGYEAFELAPGADAEVEGTGPQDEGPVTGYVAPGARCFEADSGRELDCMPDPATGKRGHAGEPNVVCRDPQGQDIACFPYRGQILAIYSIKRHFDQRADGERVVVNLDRPWHARDYMEVDWSSNLIEDPLRNFFVFLDDVRKLDNLSFDAAGREAFHVRWGQAGEMIGFDFVSRLMVEPDFSIVGDSEYPKAHECLFATDCGPGELRLRTAYRKVDRTLDFEPRAYDNEDFERFPLFRSTRMGFDPYRGAQVQNRSQLAQQFRIWKTAFERDADGVILRDERGEPIRIPYAEREVEPIVFHLSGDWPVDLISEVEGTIAEYDGVMREAVAFLRDADPEQTEDVVLLNYNGYVKRVDATGLEAECADLTARGMARSGVMSDGRVACELVGFVPSMSGPFARPELAVEWDWEEGATNAVLGDLQHHLVHYVSAAQRGGPLGYGPSTIDPETGEVLSASPTLYGAALDEYVTYALDSINLHNGRVRVEDFVAGFPEPTADVTNAAWPNPFAFPFDPASVLRAVPTDALARPREELAEVMLGEAGMRRLRNFPCSDPRLSRPTAQARSCSPRRLRPRLGSQPTPRVPRFALGSTMAHPDCPLRSRTTSRWLTSTTRPSPEKQHDTRIGQPMSWCPGDRSGRSSAAS